MDAVYRVPRRCSVAASPRASGDFRPRGGHDGAGFRILSASPSARSLRTHVPRDSGSNLARRAPGALDFPYFRESVRGRAVAAAAAEPPGWLPGKVSLWGARSISADRVVHPGWNRDPHPLGFVHACGNVSFCSLVAASSIGGCPRAGDDAGRQASPAQQHDPRPGDSLRLAVSLVSGVRALPPPLSRRPFPRIEKPHPGSRHCTRRVGRGCPGVVGDRNSDRPYLATFYRRGGGDVHGAGLVAARRIRHPRFQATALISPASSIPDTGPIPPPPYNLCFAAASRWLPAERFHEIRAL